MRTLYPVLTSAGDYFESSDTKCKAQDHHVSVDDGAQMPPVFEEAFRPSENRSHDVRYSRQWHDERNMDMPSSKEVADMVKWWQADVYKKQSMEQKRSMKIPPILSEKSSLRRADGFEIAARVCLIAVSNI